MSTLLWLPLWIGIALLLLALPVISSFPSATRHHRSASSEEEGDATVPLIPTRTSQRFDLRSSTTHRFRTILSLLTNPTRHLVLLLTVFFLASLASSDTKLLPLYISKRYGWRFSSVGYLLSVKALFNFFLLSYLIPRFLRWRQSRSAAAVVEVEVEVVANASQPAAVDAENVSNAHTCLVFSVLGALAIALSPAVWALVPSLLLYALGIALPMFTYSLLKSPSMGLTAAREGRGGEGGPGAQLFSVVMLVRTVGTLVGAVVMPSLWVAGLGMGGWALGLPFGASAVCYAVAGVLVKRIVGA